MKRGYISAEPGKSEILELANNTLGLRLLQNFERSLPLLGKLSIYATESTASWMYRNETTRLLMLLALYKYPIQL